MQRTTLSSPFTRFMMSLFLFLLITASRGNLDVSSDAHSNIKSFTGPSVRAATEAACQGDFETSERYSKILKQQSRDSPAIAAAALHILSALSLISSANAVKAVDYHRQAKALNATLIPPLAGLYLDGNKCGGLGDVFYVAAVITKQLVDVASKESSRIPTNTGENGSLSKPFIATLKKELPALVTLLADSGLSTEAERHIVRIIEIFRNDDVTKLPRRDTGEDESLTSQASIATSTEFTAIQLRAILMTPAVYESESHILAVRELLSSRLYSLFRSCDHNKTKTNKEQSQGGAAIFSYDNNITLSISSAIGKLPFVPGFDSIQPLSRLDEFALSPSFYFVYQGFRDKDFLSTLHSVYACVHPRLAAIEIPLTSSGLAAIEIPHTSSGHCSSTDKITVSSNETAHAISNSLMRESESNKRRIIRVGFMSGHFRKHSICKLFCGIIGHLNDNYNENSDSSSSSSSSSSTQAWFNITVFSALHERHEDDFTRRLIENSSIDFVRIGMPLIANRRAVIDRNIDILVYLDIGMDPSTIIWAAARLAHVQVATWGHPTTSGLSHMDYFISSRLYHGGALPSYSYPTIDHNATNTSGSEWWSENDNMNPPMPSNAKTEEQPYTSFFDPSDNSDSPYVYQQFSEQLVMLESSLGFYFERPVLEGIDFKSVYCGDNNITRSAIDNENCDNESNVGMMMTKSLAMRPLSFYEAIETKLNIQPDHTTVTQNIVPVSLADLLHMKKRGHNMRIILCPQFLPKFHPRFDVILNGLLSRIEDSVLVLVYNREGKGQWKKTLTERFKLVMGDTRASRIVWLNNLNPQEYLSLLAIGDVMIDPHPFGGGVTTLEALSVCTPVVTLPILQTVPGLAAGMLLALSSPSSSTGTTTTTTNAGTTTGGVRVVNSVVAKPGTKTANDVNNHEEVDTNNHANVEVPYDPNIIRSLIVTTESQYIDRVSSLLIEIATNKNNSGMMSYYETVRQTICSRVNLLFSQKSSVTEWGKFLRTVVPVPSMSQ